MIRSGAQMYTVREYTQTAESLLDSLRKVRAIGYEAVQLSGQSRDIPEQEIKDMLSQTGLICPATHIAFQEMQDDFPAVVRRHKLWECPYPGIGGMPAEYAMDGLEGFLRFARDATAVARKLKDEGLTFIYHNHNFEFIKFDGVTGMEVLLNECGPEVQFEVDTYWVQAGGANPLDWVRRVNGRMDIVHFKDMEIVRDDSGVRQAFCEIGRGNLNWPVIIAACEEGKVCWAFVEQDTCMRSPFESLKISYDYLAAQGIK